MAAAGYFVGQSGMEWLRFIYLLIISLEGLIRFIEKQHERPSIQSVTLQKSTITEDEVV